MKVERLEEQKRNAYEQLALSQANEIQLTEKVDELEAHAAQHGLGSATQKKTDALLTTYQQHAQAVKKLQTAARRNLDPGSKSH